MNGLTRALVISITTFAAAPSSAAALEPAPVAALPAEERPATPPANTARGGPTITKIQRIQHQLRIESARKYFTSGAPERDTTGVKVIYGDDDRTDIAKLGTGATDELAKRTANSTCLLTSRSLVLSNDAGFELELFEYRQFNLPPCSEERFKEQQVGGWCSGFLVGPDLIATAGHCCETGTDAEATEIAFVFGFYTDAGGATPHALRGDQVYFGKKVIKQRLSDEGDFAIVQLDRAVSFPGAVPFKVRRQGDPTNGIKVGMIGYPSGLPAKAAFGADTQIHGVENVWLRTNLDSYGGNSGSVVMDHTGVAEGILVRGEADYKVHDNTCFFSNKLTNQEAGEFVTRASVFAEFIPVR